MSMDLSGKTLGIIHASHITIQAMEPYIREYIPEVEIMHLCDDTIQRDNIKAGAGVIPKVNYFKFAQYAHNLEEAGVDLILLACSTFNYAAELGRPLVNTPIAQIDDDGEGCQDGKADRPAGDACHNGAVLGKASGYRGGGGGNADRAENGFMQRGL